MEADNIKEGEHHVHHSHEHHQEPSHDNKMLSYALLFALMLGIILIGLSISNQQYIYAFALIGAIGTFIPLYYRKYLIATIIATVVIIVLTIAYRIILLHFFGFYEPDGFYHYSVIRAAVLHGLVVPTYLSISGWPHATMITEPVGLYWVTLIPYFFLQLFGISYYDIIRLIPVFFAILDVIGTYFLIREFNKDKVFGLLGMLFVALSMGDAARTSATVYRGDGFVTIFVILALIFMIRTVKAEQQRKGLVYAGLTGFMLSIGSIVWNGASFGIATYLLAIAMIILYGFVGNKIETVKKSRYLLLGLWVWYVFAELYKVLNLIGTQNEAFTGIYFIILFALIFVGSEIARILLEKKEQFAVYASSPGRRLGTFCIFAAASILFIYILAPQIVYSIFVASGFQTNTGFASSIEELQAPTASFLFASFGSTIFLSPMSMVLYASTYYPTIVDLFWIGVVLASVIYFFMAFEGVDPKKFLSGKALVKFHVDEALLVILAFYAVTAYLQMHAVRFNSLLAIPLAIFTAYSVYWIMLSQKTFGRLSVALLGLFLIVPSYFILSALYPSPAPYYVAGLVAVVVGVVYYIKRSILSMIVAIAILAFLVGSIMITDTGYSVSLAQADNINPQFITALNWIHNNTSPNSVFLTLWPDGSLVEGVANRTSVTDSVGSQNKTKANPFAVWLFNSTQDPTFLTGPINGKPDYILARYTWLLETSGIYTEAGFNVTNYNQTILNTWMKSQFNTTNPAQLNQAQIDYINSQIEQLYGYNLFDQFRESVNSSIQNYTFYDSGQGFIASVLITNINGSQSVRSFLTVHGSNGQEYQSPFKNVIFYNINNATYQNVEGRGYNATNNQTLLIQYSSVPHPNAYVNITSVYMFNQGMANSNLFKLLFTCGYSACLYNNSIARLQLVYINGDSKVFKVIYSNATNTAS